MEDLGLRRRHRSDDHVVTSVNMAYHRETGDAAPRPEGAGNNVDSPVVHLQAKALLFRIFTTMWTLRQVRDQKRSCTNSYDAVASMYS